MRLCSAQQIIPIGLRAKVFEQARELDREFLTEASDKGGWMLSRRKLAKRRDPSLVRFRAPGHKSGICVVDRREKRDMVSGGGQHRESAGLRSIQERIDS